MIISAVGMIISQAIESRYTSCSFQDLQQYIPNCLQEYMDNSASGAGVRVFLRLFDALASLLLIAVGNCLENVFRGSVMSRVLSGSLHLAALLVVFEVCFSSGLSLQQRDFRRYWSYENYMPQIVATGMMVDHSFDMIWTLDNLLYTYFMLILGFLTSEHDKFSRGYTITAYVGFWAGFLSFLGNILRLGSHSRGWQGFCTFLEFGGNTVMQLTLLVIILWTGRALAGMEGDLIGKRGKKGKKGKKHRHGKNSSV